eukprot:7876428-Lingulodinium_polyedra.AAC.1
MGVKKKAFDVVLAQYRGQTARDWQQHFGTGQMKTYSLEKYTEPIAMHLAEYWCTKLQYYFRVAEESGRGLSYRYTEADHAGAPAMGKEFLALVA